MKKLPVQKLKLGAFLQFCIWIGFYAVGIFRIMPRIAAMNIHSVGDIFLNLSIRAMNIAKITVSGILIELPESKATL